MVLQHGRRFPLGRVQILPDLGALRALRHLSLAQNMLLRVPAQLSCLASLHALDLSGNRHLQLGPTHDTLCMLRAVRHLDLRAIHERAAAPHCWDAAWEETCQALRDLRTRLAGTSILHDLLVAPGPGGATRRKRRRRRPSGTA